MVSAAAALQHAGVGQTALWKASGPWPGHNHADPGCAMAENQIGTNLEAGRSAPRCAGMLPDYACEGC